MAGQRLPLEVIEARGAKHMGKAETARRREAEIRNPEPVKRLMPPKWLPEEQRAEFNRVARELIALMPAMVSRLDADSIAAYCMARSAWLSASENAAAALTGSDLEGAQGWSLVQDRYFKIARSCASDLGMTISSRCRLVVPQTQEQPDNPLEQMLRQRKQA